MKTLFILNDPPYGTERSYNGLRLAGALAKREGEEVRIFFIGDAASCAKKGQTTPNGYYNIERMMKAVTARGGELGVCGSCMDARGMTDEELAAGSHRSSMSEGERPVYLDYNATTPHDPGVVGLGAAAIVAACRRPEAR